jgi:hypothetical protein
MDSGTIADWASVTLTALAALAAAGQFAYNSYRDAARAAVDEIEKFNNDEAVRVSLRLIDWSSGSISFTDSEGRRKTVSFDSQLFQSALRPHSEKRSEIATYDQARDIFVHRTEEEDCEYLFSEVEQYVRDQFDRFLSHLERVDSLIEHSVVSKTSFKDNFSYWLDLISGAEPGHFSEVNRQALIRFIHVYKFKGVLRLFRRYGKPLVLKPRPGT